MNACDSSNEEDPPGKDQGVLDAAPHEGDSSQLDASVDAAEPPTPDPCEVQAAGQVNLPADDGAHAEAVEWWYWTGHLSDASGARYGYQITFFLFNGAAQLANVALTDLTSGVYHHAAKFSFGAPEAVEGGFTFQLGPQSATGGGGRDALHAEIGDVTLDLNVSTERAAVLQHGDGYQDYEFGGYTYYYSRPHMDAVGSLTLAGEVHEVQGSSWFDHQWGDLTAATERGWDWFAINLDDGRDVMLFLIHEQEGAPSLLGGTITDQGCVTAEIEPEALSVTATGAWTSPESGCAYPSGWRVRVGELELELTVPVLGQEMYNSRDVAKSYWEGAVDVSGGATGRAYVELAGYCAAQ